MNAPHRRRRKLIKPRLQLELIGSFLAIVALGMGLQAALFTQHLMEIATEVPAGGSYIEGQVPSVVLWTLVSSFLVLLPMTVAVGVLATFRLAGPVYRFEQHLDAVARGEDPGPCRLRKGDKLGGLCDRINLAVEALRARGERVQAEQAPDEPSRAA